MTAFMRISGGFIGVFLLALVGFSLLYGCDSRAWLTAIHHGEELDQLHEFVLNREKSQRQAVQEWIVQRRTLAETMQRFQELDQESDEIWPGRIRIIRTNPKLSAENRSYGSIRHLVESILREHPEELALALCRLEKDFQRLGSWRDSPQVTSPA